jgi:hypothetical protein
MVESSCFRDSEPYIKAKSEERANHPSREEGHREHHKICSRVFPPAHNLNLNDPKSSSSQQKVKRRKKRKCHRQHTIRNLIHSFHTMIMMLRSVFLLATTCQAYVASSSAPVTHKILVLGSSGFLGQQIVQQLDQLGIEYVAAGRNEVDLTAGNAVERVAELAKGCDAVISTVGSLGGANDEGVNAANGQAAKGAKQAGVERFVAIGNDPKVRAFSKQLPPLQKYAKGKETSEQIIKECFPESYTIVQPSFMHGGEEFTMTPPRVPAKIGQLAEDILGLYPFQSASESLPGVFGLMLMAPISRDRVATAAVNGALGLAQGDLDSRDEILKAASKRPHKEMVRIAGAAASTTPTNGANDDDETTTTPVETFQNQLYELGDCGGEAEKLEQAFALLEKIEDCNVRKPTTDTGLNGRWDFVMDVEADIGTGVVKDILEGNSPIKVVFDLKDLYMVIEDNSVVKIFVETQVLLGIPVELILTTNLIPDESDPTGTTFLEQFQGIELGGREFPVPKEWQRSRPLEFSYLDDTMLIARGNGAEPHYLKRA